MDAAEDVLTRRRILQHEIQKQRALIDKSKKTDNVTEEVFDDQGDAKKVSGSTAEVFSPQKELEDLEIKFDTMSQIIRKELEFFDLMMNEEFQTAFSAYNSNYFNLIDRTRAATSLSMVQEQEITNKDIK